MGWDLDLITDKARELEFPAKLSTMLIQHHPINYYQSFLSDIAVLNTYRAVVIEHHKEGGQ